MWRAVMMSLFIFSMPGKAIFPSCICPSVGIADKSIMRHAQIAAAIKLRPFLPPVGFKVIVDSEASHEATALPPA